jgi:hypothetical protein
MLLGHGLRVVLSITNEPSSRGPSILIVNGNPLPVRKSVLRGLFPSNDSASVVNAHRLVETKTVRRSRMRRSWERFAAAGTGQSLRESRMMPSCSRLVFAQPTAMDAIDSRLREGTQLESFSSRQEPEASSQNKCMNRHFDRSTNFFFILAPVFWILASISAFWLLAPGFWLLLPRLIP